MAAVFLRIRKISRHYSLVFLRRSWIWVSTRFLKMKGKSSHVGLVVFEKIVRDQYKRRYICCLEVK